MRCGQWGASLDEGDRRGRGDPGRDGRGDGSGRRGEHRRPGSDGGPPAADANHAAAASLASAVTGLRDRGTPYHLAHGLLDYADYLTREGDPDAAAQAVVEARDIARRLRCQPLLDRADALQAAPSRPHA